MLTPEQEKWIAHLSDTDLIRIIPFDVSAEEKFERVKERIQQALGSNVRVEHHGATSLGISGQDEIDVYMPVPGEEFGALVDRLRSVFGDPNSLYPSRRARFVTVEDGKHIDIFPINQESDDWKNLVKFEAILKANPDKLDEYRKLKEDGSGRSVREYYQRKLIFIDQALSLLPRE